MFNGIEIDMMSLGDADSILVTQWTDQYGPCRVLIDGGCGGDAKTVREFLRSRNATDLYAVVCTHPHNDHARGLIELVKDRSITFSTAWMHDIRNHVSADALRRASSGTSSQADGVRQVIETTKELTSAFTSHNVTPLEPFAGQVVSYVPSLTVLGPTRLFYKTSLEDATKVEVPTMPSLQSFLTASVTLGGTPLSSLSALAGVAAKPTPKFTGFSSLFAPPLPTPRLDVPSSFLGVLSNSSVKESPTTQPFNNTSVILGMQFQGRKCMFTADAGAEALDRVLLEWGNLAWMQVPHHGSDGNLSQKNIERFCPQSAFVSARGDMSHPSRAIVNGLIKVGAQVFSTHTATPGHLWHRMGNIPNPSRSGYGSAVPLKGNAERAAFAEWMDVLSNSR